MILESASGRFAFDQDKARALWPLEVGKSVTFDGIGNAGGLPLTFTAELSVVAIGPFESPAGTFDAALLANRLEMVIQEAEAVLETQQWLDIATGLPLETFFAVTSNGQRVQTVSMTAVEGPTAP